MITVTIFNTRALWGYFFLKLPQAAKFGFDMAVRKLHSRGLIFTSSSLHLKKETDPHPEYEVDFDPGFPVNHPVKQETSAWRNRRDVREIDMHGS